MVSEKAQATRERILQAADKLFYQYGYHATGLEQILAEGGITKGNFYYHFKSKEALAIATLDWHFGQVQNEVARIVGKNASPLQALLDVLDFFSTLIQEQKKAGGIFGCYFGNFTLEMGNENPAIRTRLRAIFDDYHAAFKELLMKAAEAKELPEPVQPEQLAGIAVSLLEGAILIDKAYQEPKEIFRAVAFLKNYLSSG